MTYKKRFLSSSIAALAVAQSLGSTVTLAQESMLEEIIVTAQKRSQSLQDVPVAVTAFSANVIQEAGINNASDVAIMTPSLNANSNSSPFTTRLQIRGIGTAQSDPALEPSVGMFIDGVFMGRSGLGMSDLTDIERIEVLQGPQGTLYGKNTNAGAISIVTKRPNMEEYEGYIEAGVGNYSLTKLTVAATGPLTDTLGFRLSANTHQRDGFYDNANPAIEDQNNADDWSVQGKLLWQPTDQLSMLLNVSHVDRDITCCGADATHNTPLLEELTNQGLPADANDPYDYKVATNHQDSFSMESDLISMHIEYEADWGNITSITAWNDYEYSTVVDADRSQLDLLVLTESNSGDSISQEFRLDSTVGDAVDYQVGLFYYDQTTQRGDGSPAFTFGEDFIAIADQQGLPLPFPTVAFIAQPGDAGAYQNVWDNETLALFGQATWHINERWHLTGGLRWTDEEREADLFSESISTAPLAAVISFVSIVSTPIDATLNRSSENVDWLAKLAYDIGDNSMLYASVSTGSKSGNFNGVNGAPETREFLDEETLSYELGFKSTLLESRLRINAAAFVTEVEDYQFQAQLATGIGTTVSNDAKVEVSGLDIQIDALPLPNLTLTAGLLYMSKYEISDGQRAGQDMPYTAELSGNLGATLVFPLADGGLFIRGDYVFMGDHLTNAGNQAGLLPSDVDDRELLNLNIGWRNDHWNVSVWGKNLTDDDYAIQTTIPQLFSGQSSYFLAPPKTYGATLRYDF